MSVVLAWETSPDLYPFDQNAYRVEVYRDGVKIAATTPWGMFEDTANEDPSASYEVRYHTLGPGEVKRVRTPEIRAWKRPAESCKVTFCFNRPDSSPWAGRKAKFVCMPQEHWVRDLWCDVNGYGYVILAWDWRILATIEGLPSRLDFAVPRVPEIALGDIKGTWVPLDYRRVV